MNLSDEQIKKYIEVLERIEIEAQGFTDVQKNDFELARAMSGLFHMGSQEWSRTSIEYLMTIQRALDTLYVERARRERAEKEKGEVKP